LRQAPILSTIAPRARGDEPVATKNVTLPLFDPSPSFDRARLAVRLRALAAQNVWIGTSSWKYEGWLNQIYTPDRYTTRGRFSRKRFEAECIAEYADTFPVVCGDFSFYQFPSPEYWTKLFACAPPRLQFALKIPEEVTAEAFPNHPRYGARAGTANESYLNVDVLKALFLEPLEPHRARLAPLIFEFGARSASPREFVAQLGALLPSLPKEFRYAVEIRNRTYLGDPYFDCLRTHGVAHVFNAWTRMPALSEQITMQGSMTADFAVVRALLRQGRPYETAVEKFSPYREAADPDPEGRAALRALIKRMTEERRTAYVFVNNRFEGNAPQTIEAITEDAGTQEEEDDAGTGDTQ
jgi:uncharacterized protein YecE (DUF72 family)